MTIRLLGGWQPAVLFELIHIPKRAPELDRAVRRSQLREKRIYDPLGRKISST
jgi:hypothetical protein